MKQNDLNILKFYDSVEQQDHRKHWSFDQVLPLSFELDFIPMFQLSVLHDSGALTEITELFLVDFQTEVETDILSEAVLTGLEVQRIGDYDNLIYHSVLPLGLAGIAIGAYYLKVRYTDGLVFSEVFTMCDDLSNLIKVEYWHQETFFYNGGLIEYTFPYKQRLYIHSDIGKPSYEYEERVVTRESKKLPIQQITYKLYKFLMLGNEPLFDAIRAIRLHDHCIITYGGYTFDVDEFLMNNPSWQKQANIAQAEIEFRTDTVVTSNGRAYTSTEYIPEAGACISADITAKAILIDGSVNYLAFQYTPMGGGSPVPLLDTEYILKSTAGVLTLEQYNSSSYAPIAGVDSVYVETTDDYYLFDAVELRFRFPYITDVLSNLVEGVAFAEGFVDVYGRNTGDIDEGTLLISVPATTFNATGAVVNTTAYDEIMIRSRSFMCASFADSVWFIVTGSGIEINWVIESTNTVT